MTLPAFDRRLLLALLLLGWTVAASGLEIYRSVWLWHADPWTLEQPSTWRITSAQVDALEDLLAPIERQGATAAVWPVGDPQGEGLFFYLWTRYLLPDSDVRLIARPSDPLQTDYLITGAPVTPPAPLAPRLMEIRRSSVGVLYRVVTPDPEGRS